MSPAAPAAPDERLVSVEPFAAATYALDPTQVQVGSNNGPGLYLAPSGTAGPTDTVSPWPAAWSILGYASNDGATVGSSTDTNEIVPWQSIVPLFNVMVKRLVTMKFTLWQLNALTLGLYFDADVPAVVAAPAAPTLSTAASGGTVLAGTYQAVVTYVTAAGESAPSPAGSQVTTGSVSTLTCPSPAAVAGATGWNLYMTQAGGSTFTKQNTTANVIGTPQTLTAPPTSTGAAPSSSGSLSMQVRSDKAQHLYAVGLDAADANHAFRMVFPSASLTDAGDMQIKRGEAVPLEVTLTALDNAGVLANVYLGPHA